MAKTSIFDTQAGLGEIRRRRDDIAREEGRASNPGAAMSIPVPPARYRPERERLLARLPRPSRSRATRQRSMKNIFEIVPNRKLVWTVARHRPRP